MNDDLHYFCPQCQGMELEINRSAIIGGTSSARCKLCGWEGQPDDLLATINPQGQQFWTGEKVANVLLVAAAKYAAGPMTQVLELIGLIPKISGSAEEQQSAQEVRETVVKAVLEAVVTAAFESAAATSVSHYERFSGASSEEVSRIFNYAEVANDRS